jgi:hypothetical protein
VASPGPIGGRGVDVEEWLFPPFRYAKCRPLFLLLTLAYVASSTLISIFCVHATNPDGRPVQLLSLAYGSHERLTFAENRRWPRAENAGSTR